MKIKNIFLSILFISVLPISAQDFHQYYTDNACRVDFHFCGNDSVSEVFFDEVKKEPFWGGREKHLDNDLNLGDYRYLVLDSATKKTIFVDGFSTLFREWQATPEAKTMSKSFEQSFQFPYPKNTVTLIIEERTDFDAWKELARMNINPADKLIDRTPPINYPVKIINKSADTDKAIDIAVIAEGYTADQQDKFYKDAKRLFDNLLTHEPFKKYENRFNIYAIAAVSQDSGVTVPHDSIWKNTLLNTHLYTFYSPRYMTSFRIKKMRDIAAAVPYDYVYVLVNTDIYGGGGFFNFYTLAAADNKFTPQVSVHEFGHGFAGLGDEYYYDDDALNDFYDLKKEPWEPNITTLVHFDKKWKSMIKKDTPTPTPVTEENKYTVGLYEGAGYNTKGMYRPYIDCRMKTNAFPSFCPVCEKAIERRILFLTE